MPDKIAPCYDEVASYLENIVRTTMTVPSVRDLKRACGGLGSIATYQTYLSKWLAESGNSSSPPNIVRAMEAERRTHAAIMSLYFSRMSLLAEGVPTQDGDTVSVALVPDSVAGLQDEGAEAAKEVIIPSASFDDGRAMQLAAQSVARFTAVSPPAEPCGLAPEDKEDRRSLGATPSVAVLDVEGLPVRHASAISPTEERNDKDDYRPGGNQPASSERAEQIVSNQGVGVEEEWRGHNTPAHPKPTPASIDRPAEAMAAPLSRSDGGYRQVAHPAGTNQPEPGESDT